MGGEYMSGDWCWGKGDIRQGCWGVNEAHGASYG